MAETPAIQYPIPRVLEDDDPPTAEEGGELKCSQYSWLVFVEINPVNFSCALVGPLKITHIDKVAETENW